jgi:hypothetical protein
MFSTLSRSWLTAIAIAFGLLTLAGYFFTTPLLTGLRVLLLNLAVILAGFAVFVGVANLLNVHFKKISKKQKGSAYSTVLVIFLVTTFLLGLVARFSPAVNSIFSGAFNYIQLPVEASLMAVLAVTLILAAIRLLRRRLNLLSILFLVTALLVLFTTVSLPFIGEVPGLSKWVSPILSQVFATAGARGILLGVALGTLVMGLRILFGADRPYGGK